MGVDTYINLGPHARCKKEIVEKEKEYEGCPKCKKDYMSGAFCEKCGSKRGTFKKTVKRPKVEAMDVIEATNERLSNVFCNTGDFNENFDYFVANIKVPAIKRDTSPDLDDKLAMPLTPDIIQSEIKAFEDFFEKEIKILYDLYGKDNVVIEWGLLIYYN